MSDEVKKNKKAKIEERFVDSVGQSSVPSPEDKDGHKGRSADKLSGGETEIPDFPTKVEAMNAVVQAMTGMPKEKIADIFKGMTAGHDKDKALATRRIGGTAKDDSDGETLASTYRSPTSAKGVAAEDMNVIFGDDLTEEMRDKAKTIFEAAVNTHINQEIVRLEEEYKIKLEEALEEKITALSENIDKYLSYVIEEWVKENEVAIENGLKADVVENFINGLKDLFAENYVEIPDDKVDVVAELSQHVTELEKKLDDVVKENLELADYVDDLEVEKAFNESVETLPLTHKDKFRSLVEGIEYSTVGEFTKKLDVIKESFFAEGKSAPSNAATLTEATDFDAEEGEEVVVDNTMKNYMQAISRSSKK
jgi:hypothetical protein